MLLLPAPPITMLGGIHVLSSEDTRTRGKQNTMRSSPFGPAFRAVTISSITCSMASLSLFELRSIFGFSQRAFPDYRFDVIPKPKPRRELHFGAMAKARQV